MLIGNVIYKLLNKHRLAYSCTAEKTYLSAFQIWCDKVDDLDTGFQNLV